MKGKNTVTSAVIAVTQSNWMRRARLTLAILATALVATGCTPHH